MLQFNDPLAIITLGLLALACTAACALIYLTERRP